jgi:hypothetical protein
MELSSAVAPLVNEKLFPFQGERIRELGGRGKGRASAPF